ADFGAGTPDAGIFIGNTTQGKVSLMPAAGTDFSGSTLPAGWFSSTYAAGGAISFGAGATVNGARLGTNAFYSAGRSLEFVATFSGGADYQDIGFAADLNSPPWAIFGTWSGGMYARSQNAGTAINTSIYGNFFGTSHLYRIDWTASSIV